MAFADQPFGRPSEDGLQCLNRESPTGSKAVVAGGRPATCGGVTLGLMPAIVPESWLEWGVLAWKRTPTQGLRKLMCLRCARRQGCKSARQHQRRLGNVVNRTRHAALAAALGGLRRQSPPRTPDYPFGRREARQSLGQGRSQEPTKGR